MEEELIYELVDCIINNQDKIKELNNKIQSPFANEIYQKEIQYKNLLSSNIKKIDNIKMRKKITIRNFKNMQIIFISKLKKLIMKYQQFLKN